MKIVTFNLRNFTDDHWEERLPLIGNDIIKLGAEIFAFQEVRGYIDESKGKDMAQQVLDYLLEQGHPYPYLIEHKAMVYESQGVWEGLAIMSTIPHADWGFEKLNLGSGSDGNKRIMLWARFNHEDYSFYVSNNHFSYDQDQATGNAEQVVSYLDNRKFDYPGLLMGDLNATPGDPAVNYLKTHNWEDLWEKIHPQKDGFTYASRNASKRIDYHWKNAYFNKKIKSMEKVFLKKDTVTGEYPSDHYGVMITF